jgi:hypothetical protein
LQAILYSALPGLITKGNVHAKAGVDFCLRLGVQKSKADEILWKSVRGLQGQGFGIE